MIVRTPDLGLVEILPTREGCRVHYLRLGIVEDVAVSPAHMRHALLAGAPVEA